MQIAIVLGLLVVAVILFMTEKLSVDIVTLLLLIVLTTTGILTTEEAFAAFGSDFIIILASIFIITNAIEESGVLDALSSRISNTKPAKLSGLLAWLIPFTGFMSAFMNNTTVTALLISPAVSLSKKSNIPVSKILMPMAFASIVGGTCTLIGTSTNVAVGAYLAKNNIAQLRMFDFVWIGLAISGISFIYLLTIGRLLLPVREQKELGDFYEVREYTSEIKILTGSKLIGQNVPDSELNRLGFSVLSVIRDNRKLYFPDETYFKANDIVLVRGNIKDLMSVKEKNGIDIMGDTIKTKEDEELEEQQLFEVLIPVESSLIGITVKQARLLQRYGIVVMAVNRTGTRITQKIGSVKLEVGDLLLVQGSRNSFKDFHDNHNMIVLEEFSVSPNRIKKGYMAIGLFMIAVIVSSFNLIPLSIAFLLAAIATVLLKIVAIENVYKSIDWRMLVLIAGMSAFGIAMVKTGADKYLSGFIMDVFEPLGPKWVMVGFMVLTVLLTQPMSNAAAALVVLPIAIETAHLFHVNPLTYSMAIMLSASVSLATPFEPSCILVYGPGKYKFFDFVKVGGPLTLILMAVIFFGVQMLWAL
jgi:di/tricarboxylate transporter